MSSLQFYATLLAVAAGVGSIVTGMHARQILSDPDSLPMQRSSVANAFVLTTTGFLLTLLLLAVLKP